ncbi:MAG: peptide ABC transporter substrate-binding protein [Ruminococcaceae bacterium]|nr:peptide ABC transporter substrate-binding protein [Oscillospiraceae bacterium]
MRDILKARAKAESRKKSGAWRRTVMLRAAALLAAVGMLFALTGCQETTDGSDHGFSYSLTANPRNLDPQMASDNNSLLVIKNLFEGLMRIGADGELIYGVAESYTVSEDNTEYVFNLRKDAKWSNGEPVTAYDFEFAWRRAVMPETKSPTVQSVYCIRGAEAINRGMAEPETLGVTVVGDHTLKVVLEYPYAEFPLQTTLAVYMPCNQAFFESTGGHYGLEDDYIISNGPFAFSTESTAWNPDNYVRMMRNEHYSGENKCQPRILYLGIRQPSTDYYALLDETVEAAKIESENVAKIDASKYRTYTYTDCTWGILYNTAATGFENAYVRQAFSLCVETGAYENYLKDNTEVAYDIIPPATKLNGVIYRELAGSGMKLKAARSEGYPLLKKGLAMLERSSMPTITVICPDDPQVVEMMQQVVQSWQDSLLLYVNLEPLSEDTLNNRVAIGDYQLALWKLAPSKDGPLTCLKLFASDSSSNPAKLKSGAYDYLVEQASAKTTTEDIIAPMVAAEKYLNDMAVFFPMYYETTYYATWKEVEGIYFSPFDGTADYCNAVYYGD